MGNKQNNGNSFSCSYTKCCYLNSNTLLLLLCIVGGTFYAVVYVTLLYDTCDRATNLPLLMSMCYGLFSVNGEAEIRLHHSKQNGHYGYYQLFYWSSS